MISLGGLTTMKNQPNDRTGRIFGYVLTLLAGVVLGQLWAYGQHENRRDLCSRGFTFYCEEPVTPADR